MLENIPIELRQLKQWVNADMSLKENGEPKKTPLTPATGSYASVDNPETWGTFNEAVATGKPVGFVLTKDDPYCIIDLDDKITNPASTEEKERFSIIVNTFNTYTEISNSGRGAHLIVRGTVPKGINRGHVEIYSEGRYMICTGQVIRALPVAERQELLDNMYSQMQPVPIIKELKQVNSVYSDVEIVQRAENASNGDKFTRLWQGAWRGLYFSQSEADLALASMLCFYTKDNEQVIRLFRQSELGKREKAQRDEYFMGNYGIINKIRASEPPPIDFTNYVSNVKATIAKAREYGTVVTEIEIPEGLVGDLTHYFMATALRPVKEIALAAALGLMAGVTGRSYNTPTGAGLNLYIILLAKTGSGKEGMASGIERLLKATKLAGVPMVDDFVGPAAFSSGQALIKVLSTKPCFFSILGEFGFTLQELSDPRSNSAVRMLKKVLLDLYSKSGANDTLRSSVYSDTEKNTSVVQSPSVTILGETTPETFFESLTESQIAEGLIPRFSIIQYRGERPDTNDNAGCQPSDALVQQFTTVLASTLTAIHNSTFIPVAITDAAQHLLKDFDKSADQLIRRHKEGSPELQLWNRAHLKAMKLASIIAVGNNPSNPLITENCAKWAIKFVTNDITLIASQFHRGEVGNGDNKQLADLRNIIMNFLTNSLDISDKSHEIYLKLQEISLIPYRFVHNRSQIASFRNDKIGQTAALKKALQTLIDTGELKLVPVHQFNHVVKFEGIVYSISENWGRV